MTSRKLLYLVTVATTLPWCATAQAQTTPVQAAPVDAPPADQTAAPAPAVPAIVPPAQSTTPPATDNLSNDDAAPISQPTEASASGDIVVTAQRRSQRLQDVPVAAAVVTGDTLVKLGIRDLTELSTRLPGLKLGASTQSDILSIRGVSSGNAAGFEQAVGTFVDGVYRGRSRSARAALFDIERVEVLKGPQTTFFGNNTIAGALNITSRKPTDTLSYNFNTLVSPSDGEFNLEGGISGPITSTLSGRIAAKYSGMNGYIYNTNLGENGPHLRDFVGRVALRWEPSSNFTSNFRFDVSRNRDRNQYNAEIVDCPPPAAFGAARGTCAIYLAQNGGVVDDKLNYRSSGAPSYFRLNMYEGVLSNELRLGDFTISALTSYFDQYANTFVATQASPIRGWNNTVNGNPFNAFERYKSYSQELRVQSPTGRFLEFMAGAYYLHGDLDITSYAGTYRTSAGAAGAPVTTATTPIVGVRNLDQTEQTVSVFGSATLNFTSRLKLNLGLRYTHVNKDATRSIQAGIGQYIPGPDYIRVPADVEARLITALAFSTAPFAQPDKNYTDLMPAVSVQYKLNSDITSYASYTEGFLAGGFTDTGTPQQFDSEFVKAYEVGVKGSLMNRAIFFSLDAFRSDYSDLQESFSFNSPLPPFTVLSEIRNVAAARSQGVEFNGTYRVSDWLSFNGDLSYIDTKYQNYRSAPCTVLQSLQIGSNCTQNLSGRPRILSPEFSGIIGANVTIPVHGDYTIGINPQVYHSSSYYYSASLEPQLMQRAYEKVDLRVDFGPRDRRWEVALMAKNLNNAVTTSVGTVYPAAGGTVIKVPDRPRSIAFSVTLRN